MTARWPEPADLPVDRARRIANTLLAHLPDDLQADMIRAARLVGETWLGASLLRFTVDDVVTTGQAAEVIHVGAATIRKWHSLGYLDNQGTGRYRLGDVLDCAAARRRERDARASGLDGP